MIRRPSSDTLSKVRRVPCPDCGKERLIKRVMEDGQIEETSSETVEVRGEVRHIDVCMFCKTKYEKRDQKFVMDNLRKVQKAAQNRDKASDSDHEDFTLDM